MLYRAVFCDEKGTRCCKIKDSDKWCNIAQGHGVAAMYQFHQVAEVESFSAKYELFLDISCFLKAKS